MSTYVLDASVAAKWFLPAAGETLVSESLQILEGYSQGRINLQVPDLFWPEIGNILWKAVRQGRLSTESAKQALYILAAQNIPTRPSQPILSDAFEIAAAFQRCVYDSLYVALALASGKLLVTADERLANSLAAHFPVRWLGSL